MSTGIPIVNKGFYYVNGMVVSNNATTPNTKIDVALGQCRDSTNIFDITLSAGVTINAATTGINALDAGSLAASTWYYVHAVMDAFTAQATGAILSLSATAPTLPYGYNAFRKIGIVRTDGSSHFLLATTTGAGTDRELTWDTAISITTNGTATTLTALSLDAAVPPIDNTSVLFNVAYTPTTANDFVSLASPGSVATVLPNLSSVVAAKIQTGQLRQISKIASSVAKILYINSAASGNTGLLVSSFKYSL